MTSVDRSSRQKVNKETAALNNTLGQMDIFNIYRALLPKALEYTIFFRLYDTLDHKTHLGFRGGN